MDNRPIGIFDSGIGGLTVVNAINKILPNESICYVGDTARVPYGNKSKNNIKKFSKQITNWLLKQDCKIIIVACNTASALALNYLKCSLSIPIIGVIDPGVNWALSNTKNKKIGVIGTRATINSDIYSKKLYKSDKEVLVFSKACPLFVPLVEEGLISGDIPLLLAKFYLTELRKIKIDTLILGCTHYPLLNKVISDVLDSSIKLVDSSLATSDVVNNMLKNNNMLSSDKKGEINCFVTDHIGNFKAVANRFYSLEINSFSQINVF